MAATGLLGINPFQKGINLDITIFNKENVDDDAREASHMYQVMRHERFLHRMRTGDQKEKHGTLDEYPADICVIARMTVPNFKMNIEEL